MSVEQQKHISRALRQAQLEVFNTDYAYLLESQTNRLCIPAV